MDIPTSEPSVWRGGLSPSLDEELFRLNLAYLLTARQLLTTGDGSQAELLLGVEEPLASWLPQASLEAILRLARSPAVFYELRLGKAVEHLLRACEGAPAPAWLTELHVALRSLDG
ncbi:MAG: flagellar transcriptional regulator FlhD [Gammaproteobacteria bacterium]|jgi:hypothetical protein|nr:flagellar transcriptional regulator FlhD [Gammaproteobacteria bacterium]